MKTESEIRAHAANINVIYKNMQGDVGMSVGAARINAPMLWLQHEMLAWVLDEAISDDYRAIVDSAESHAQRCKANEN